MADFKPFMALFLTKDLDDPVHLRIGVWQISESEAELRAMTSIPSDELEEISYIKSESLRKQKLAVRALLDAMFEDKVYLSHHDNGKTKNEKDDNKRNEQLAIYWCAKEAIYKLTSQYDVDFAEQIELDNFRFRDEGDLDATFTDDDGYEQEYELHYFTFDRHVLVWVTD